MIFFPDNGNGYLKCPTCFFRLIPDKKIMKGVSLDYIILARHHHVNDPRLLQYFLIPIKEPNGEINFIAKKVELSYINAVINVINPLFFLHNLFKKEVEELLH